MYEKRDDKNIMDKYCFFQCRWIMSHFERADVSYSLENFKSVPNVCVYVSLRLSPYTTVPEHAKSALQFRY